MQWILRCPASPHRPSAPSPPWAHLYRSHTTAGRLPPVGRSHQRPLPRHLLRHITGNCHKRERSHPPLRAGDRQGVFRTGCFRRFSGPPHVLSCFTSLCPGAPRLHVLRDLQQTAHPVPQGWRRAVSKRGLPAGMGPAASYLTTLTLGEGVEDRFGADVATGCVCQCCGHPTPLLPLRVPVLRVQLRQLDDQQT